MKIFLSILSFCLLFFTACEKKQTLEIGKMAPDIKVMDLKEKIEKLSDFKGKVVILRFWEKGCPACLEEMPRLDKFYQKHKKNLVIMPVLMGDDMAYVKAYKKEHNLSYPMYFDQLGIATKRYKANFSPTSFIIDKKGVLVDQAIGDMYMKDFYKIVLNTINQE
ncbi:MAG: TlpA family protein disulfide reductase [Arcobacter sp.]|nr:TlpA family protein disulfide reductase [Arcobacter sp.]